MQDFTNNLVKALHFFFFFNNLFHLDVHHNMEEKPTMDVITVKTCHFLFNIKTLSHISDQCAEQMYLSQPFVYKKIVNTDAFSKLLSPLLKQC